MVLKSGTKIKTAFDTYTIKRQMGVGGSGVVCEAVDEYGNQFAVKILHKDKTFPSSLKRFKNEAYFCSQEQHRNIIRVVGSGITDDDAVFYVMPLFARTLRALIREQISAENVLPIFNQMLDGVEAAHLKGVWHRDLKPENILYSPTDDQVVIADFGIAHFEEEDLYTAIETRNDERLANFMYAAPEQKHRGKNINSKADIFALGLILHVMFTGEVPLGTGHRRIADVTSQFSYLDELVDIMRSQDPAQRPSIDKVKQELVARGNQFVALQRLNDLKKKVIPESEITDRIIDNPIRIVEKLDYQNGQLRVRLNQPVNKVWVQCFENRATRFSGNVSSAVVSFIHDTATITVTEHFVQEGVNFVKDYLDPANEDYAALIKREHREGIERRRTSLRNEVAREEARQKILNSIKI